MAAIAGVAGGSDAAVPGGIGAAALAGAALAFGFGAAPVPVLAVGKLSPDPEATM